MKKLLSAVVSVALGLGLFAPLPSQAHDDDWHGVDRRFEERREIERHRRFEERRDFHRWGGPRVFLGAGPYMTWGPGFVVNSYPASVYTYTPPPPAYWYFCPSYREYYPNVPTCPEPWMPVLPR